MKVYAVTDDSTEKYCLYGVFSTRDLANEFAEKARTHLEPPLAGVEEWTVDERVSDRPRQTFYFGIDMGGTIYSRSYTQILPPDEPDDPHSEQAFANSNGYCFAVSHVSMDRAKELVSDLQREQLGKRAEVDAPV